MDLGLSFIHSGFLHLLDLTVSVQERSYYLEATGVQVRADECIYDPVLHTSPPTSHPLIWTLLSFPLRAQLQQGGGGGTALRYPGGGVVVALKQLLLVVTYLGGDHARIITMVEDFAHQFDKLAAI